MSAAPSFAADAMLGRLARWLRVLGWDTFYDAAVADPVLVRLAETEGRILVTRDRHLLRELKPLRAVEVRHDRPLEQLRHLVQELDLPAPTGLFTRCMLCNAPLSAPLASQDVLRLLPEDFGEPPSAVRRCPSCGRVYWHGSHTRRMRLALERALPQWAPLPGP